MVEYIGTNFYLGQNLSCKFEINDSDFKMCCVIAMLSTNMCVYRIHTFGIYTGKWAKNENMLLNNQRNTEEYVRKGGAQNIKDIQKT